MKTSLVLAFDFVPTDSRNLYNVFFLYLHAQATNTPAPLAIPHIDPKTIRAEVMRRPSGRSSRTLKWLNRLNPHSIIMQACPVLYWTHMQRHRTL